jgi:prophage regulatory protein
MKRLIRLSEVRKLIGLSRSEIYRRISLGEFPKQVPLGERTVAWDADEIEAFIAGRIAARASQN